MGSELPNDVVGETVPASIGPLETAIEIQSFEHEYTTVSYKPNRVRVTARTNESNRSEAVLGPIQFTVTEGYWRELNKEVRDA